MLISLIITPDFIEKTCQKEFRDLGAFLKIILYEDPYIFIFKNPHINKNNLLKLAKKADVSGMKFQLWNHAFEKIISEQRFKDIDPEYLEIAKSKNETIFVDNPDIFFKYKALENKIFSSSTIEHNNSDALNGVELLGESNQLQEYKLKQLIKNNCRIGIFPKNNISKDLFIEKLGGYSLLFNTCIIFDKFIIKPYEINDQLDGESIFQISKFLAASNLEKLIIITAEYWESTRNPKRRETGKGRIWLEDKRDCLDRYLKIINKNLGELGKEIHCEIILLPEKLCSGKHFRKVLFGNLLHKKSFQFYDITKKNRASFIPIQLDNGCNYFKNKNESKTYQFKYLYKEDMQDFFDSFKDLTIHKLGDNIVDKEYWLENYKNGNAWLNVNNYLSEI